MRSRWWWPARSRSCSAGTSPRWFRQLWDAITGISAVYVVAACMAGLVQTTATAFGWWAILRYGFPDAQRAVAADLGRVRGLGRAERDPSREPRAR